jgi:hypothetical protein
MVQPGITGLAQINLPPDSDLDSVRRKLILDCDYVRTAGWWLDARILICTALRLIWLKGPAVTRMLGLERVACLPVATAGRDAEAAAEPTAPVSLSSLVSSTVAVPARVERAATYESAGSSARAVATPHSGT